MSNMCVVSFPLIPCQTVGGILLFRVRGRRWMTLITTQSNRGMSLSTKTIKNLVFLSQLLSHWLFCHVAIFVPLVCFQTRNAMFDDEADSCGTNLECIQILTQTIQCLPSYGRLSCSCIIFKCVQVGIEYGRKWVGCLSSTLKWSGSCA